MDSSFDRPMLRLSATLLLVGQLLYVVITFWRRDGWRARREFRPYTQSRSCWLKS